MHLNMFTIHTCSILEQQTSTFSHDPQILLDQDHDLLFALYGIALQLVYLFCANISFVLDMFFCELSSTNHNSWLCMAT